MNASTNNNAETNEDEDNARVDDLLKFFRQSKGATESSSPFRRKIFWGKLDGSWKIEMQDSDWNRLIERGFTWKEFTKCVWDKGDKCFVIGPMCITYYCQINTDLSEHMSIDHLQFYRMKTHHTEEQVKNTFAALGKLLYPAQQGDGSCTIYTRSVLLDCIMKHRVKFRTLDFHWGEPRMMHSLMDNSCWDVLKLDSCSFAGNGSQLCKFLIARKLPLKYLCLYDITIDMSRMAKVLHTTFDLKRLHLRSYRAFRESGWDVLIKAVARMQILTSVEITGNGYCSTSKWMEWLLLLIGNTSLYTIKFTLAIHSSLPEPDADAKKRNTEAILETLKKNEHILKLGIVCRNMVDEDMIKTQIRPFLIRRQVKRVAGILASKDDAASLFGSILRRLNSPIKHDELFELLVNTSETVRMLWDSGREKRILKSEEIIRDATTKYMETVANAYSWRAGTALEESLALSAAFRTSQQVVASVHGAILSNTKSQQESSSEEDDGAN